MSSYSKEDLQSLLKETAEKENKWKQELKQMNQLADRALSASQVMETEDLSEEEESQPSRLPQNIQLKKRSQLNTFTPFRKRYSESEKLVKQLDRTGLEEPEQSIFNRSFALGVAFAVILGILLELLLKKMAE